MCGTTGGGSTIPVFWHIGVGTNILRARCELTNQSLCCGPPLAGFDEGARARGARDREGPEVRGEEEGVGREGGGGEGGEGGGAERGEAGLEGVEGSWREAGLRGGGG
eukprot:3185825-Rhodomonas_salina.1